MTKYKKTSKTLQTLDFGTTKTLSTSSITYSNIVVRFLGVGSNQG